ncbi:hypothetical protein V8921_17915 [Ralstonia mannitolilytica]|uniref:hypothetical protein n=1 Tax=Ralstonia mannitolilytica TaxID=105219 RepID=UPI001F26769A|nr:hypothetical protein [Ralstonia mannitolilytica]
MEYQNKTSSRKGVGVGDVFVKWVLTNLQRPDKVHQVTLNQHAEDHYAEFPDADLEKIFDASDRKFVAVAYAHPKRPPIWQAVDCKWLDWWEPLKKHGITIEFLCKDDACRFYAKKFSGKPLPKLP